MARWEVIDLAKVLWSEFMARMAGRDGSAGNAVRCRELRRWQGR